MCTSELLEPQDLKTVNMTLAYTERTLRVIAEELYDIVRPTQRLSTHINEFLTSMEPWYTVSDKGRMTKRISKHYYDQYGFDLDESTRALVGNFLNYDAPPGPFHYDVTNVIDWKAGDFGDHGSCFLISRLHAVAGIEDYGATALRFWKSATRTKGIARTWVAPHQDKPVVFNAYGLSLTQYASFLRGLYPEVPQTYVYLTNKGSSDGTVYINGGIGLLLGEEAEDFDLSVDLSIEPASKMMRRCGHCHMRSERVVRVNVREGVGFSSVYMCPRCATAFPADAVTGERWPSDEMRMASVMHNVNPSMRGQMRRGEVLPIRIAQSTLDAIFRCSKCQRLALSEAFCEVGTLDWPERTCVECAHEHTRMCRDCGRYLLPGDTHCRCGYRNPVSTMARDY